MSGMPIAAVAIRAANRSPPWGDGPCSRGRPCGARSSGGGTRGGRPAGARLSKPHTSEPPLAGLIAADGFEEIQLLKIGPVHVGEIQFRVGGLPQQEVAQPMLAAGADEQIRVRQVRGEQALVQGLLIDLVRRQPAGGNVPRQPPGGFDDLAPAAVIQRQV